MNKALDKRYRRERSLREQLKNLNLKLEKVKKTIADTEATLAELKKIPAPPLALEPKPDNHDYCGKILYVSQHAAQVAMKVINADLKEVGKDTLQRAYFCERCEAWHLTTIA